MEHVKHRSSANLLVRHMCSNENLCVINKDLTIAQRKRIQMTPFSFLVHMSEKLVISGVLLEEMLSRWVDIRSGFRVGRVVVSFSPLDVCLGLGLRILGSPVNLDDHDHCDSVEQSHTKGLFHGRDRKAETIVDMIKEYNRDDSIDDFCRLYILLAFAQFFMPKTTDIVDVHLLKYMDDLDALPNYAWGKLVYDFLFGSLSRAAVRVREAKNCKQVHITGCVAVLQLWAAEHLSLYDRQKSDQKVQFPRVLHCLTLEFRSKKMKKAFNKNMIIENLSATTSELAVEVVNEAFKQTKDGFQHWSHTRDEIDGITAEQKHLRTANADLRGTVGELGTRVSLLENELSSIKQQILNALRHSTASPPECQPPRVFDFEEAGITTVNEHNIGKQDAKFGTKTDIRVEVNEHQPRQERVVEGKHVVLDQPEQTHTLSEREMIDLYTAVTAECKASKFQALNNMVRIGDQILTSLDLQTMGRRKLLNTTILNFASKVFMLDDKVRMGRVTRYLLNHLFMDQVRKDFEIDRCSKISCSQRSILGLLHIIVDEVAIIRQADLVFAPALIDDHWYCYVLHIKQRKLFVLDSFPSGIHDERITFDKHVKNCLEHLLVVFNRGVPRDDVELEILYPRLPEQCNPSECGIYVLKYMELWDGQPKEGDATMPVYTQADIDRFRREYVCKWVLHADNTVRAATMAVAKSIKRRRHRK